MEKLQPHKGKIFEEKWKYVSIPIIIFEIKYKSGPDRKEYKIIKYFRLTRDSKSGKLLIDDQEVWPVPWVDNRVLKSTPLR